jgi:hypothetical protein
MAMDNLDLDGLVSNVETWKSEAPGQSLPICRHQFPSFLGLRCLKGVAFSIVLKVPTE